MLPDGNKIVMNHSVNKYQGRVGGQNYIPLKLV